MIARLAKAIAPLVKEQLIKDDARRIIGANNDEVMGFITSDYDFRRDVRFWLPSSSTLAETIASKIALKLVDEFSEMVMNEVGKDELVSPSKGD